MILTFRYEGNTPSKKNQKQIFRGKQGRPFITASAEFKKWHGAAVWEMKRQRSGIMGIAWPLPRVARVIVTLYYEDRRRRDASNTLESIMDLLVDAEILADDSWTATGPIGIFPQLREDRPGWTALLEIPEAAPGRAEDHRYQETPQA